MQSSLYVSLSAQLALNQRLDTIAHNIANVTTPGFRGQGIKFDSLVQQFGSGTIDYASSGQAYITRQGGEIIQTGNPLDAAIKGDVWFGLSTSAGQVVYTRDGRMQMAADGQLLSIEGLPVVDPGGGPLKLDPKGGPPVITSTGAITQGGKQIGALGLFSLDPAAKLSYFRNSSVVSDLPATPVVDTGTVSVVQGAIEGSNVNAMTEMTRLISVTRAFESAQAAVNDTEKSYSDAIKTLG
jgi:flagellar basal-body rod protein FlgF